MPTWTVTIPGFLPASVNQLFGAHWARGHRRKKADCELIALYCIEKGVPIATGKRRVAVTFCAPGGRGAKHADADNRLKVLLDALVRCGRLVDDSPTWCEWQPPAHEKGPKKTVIVLEDVGDEEAV